MTLNAESYKKIIDNLSEGIYFIDTNRKITYWNKAAEEITGYKSSEIIGISCADSILVHVDDRGNNLCKNENLCPVSKSIAGGESMQEELYLRHKDGHRMPVTVRTFPVKNSNEEIIGVVEIFKDNSNIIWAKQRIEGLEKLALLDQVTKVGNRRFAEMNLHSRLEESNRFNWQFGVLFADIDDFKKINDIYGHTVGDKVLKMVANTLSNNLRAFDIVCRWGGRGICAYN